MLREIVLDTETTGLDPRKGDRLIEIGCIEIVNRIPTGREFHLYINPERDVHPDAVAVHGLTRDSCKDKPLFKDVADEFLTFIGDAPLVIHNANFDMGFINTELASSPGRRSRPIASSIPWRWPAASTRPVPTRSMRCASATASTTPSAPSTAP